MLYKLEYLDYEGACTGRIINSTPVNAPVRPVNSCPWIEVTKSVKSTYKRPADSSSGAKGLRDDKPKAEGRADEEYDLTNIETTTLKIRSAYIINALRHVIQFYPLVSLTSETLTLRSPFGLLVHHKEELQKYKSSHPSAHDEKYRKECNEHIDVALRFIEEELGEKMAKEDVLYKKDPPMATFQNLWMLLKPGQVIYTKVDGELTPVVIHSTTAYQADNGMTIVQYCVVSWCVFANELCVHKLMVLLQESQLRCLSIHAIATSTY